MILNMHAICRYLGLDPKAFFHKRELLQFTVETYYMKEVKYSEKFFCLFNLLYKTAQALLKLVMTHKRSWYICGF